MSEIRALEERLAREVLLPSMFRVELDPGSGEVLLMRESWSRWEPWHPWTSVEDAVECLEAVPETTWEIHRNWTMPPNHWTVREWVAGGGAVGSAPTLPEAICKALEAWLDAKD